jgi:hypothetical protein
MRLNGVDATFARMREAFKKMEQRLAAIEAARDANASGDAENVNPITHEKSSSDANASDGG